MVRSDGFATDLAATLDELAAKHRVPGVSVAVLRGDEVALATSGVVNTRTGVPVTPDSLFMVQSVTKVVTATLVMQLLDDGLVALDDPVVRHLPRFRTGEPEQSRRITIRHLLTHTGGFEGDLWAPTTAGPDALERFVADLVGEAPQVSPPGERFSYCNAGFGTLGRLVEVLRDETFEQAVRTRIAEPLGIEEIAFWADQALAFRTAIGHVGDDLRPLRHWAVMPPSNPAAGNQLALSARGLLSFARMHLDDGRAPDGTRLLGAATARMMREPQVEHPAVLGPHSRQGLGWWLRRGGLVEHGGGSLGVSSMLRTSPRHRVAAVVLTNSESGGRLVRELLEPWFADLPGVEPEPPPREPAAELAGDAAPYVGVFASRQVRAEVTQGDVGRLWLHRSSRGDALVMAASAGTDLPDEHHQLLRVGGDVFRAVGAGGPGPDVEFLGRDADGRCRFLFLGSRVLPRVG
ncbi:serine hydrolase domain-containing protein [Phycicoccus sonneratiae]|uniref:Beta-lactamase family protein n=1 Tax=Phycicoccus sonneratiae TaxID=2807628 RepID=A0ABS2CPR3_9MICO|nr:serine hydrolase domain-containing protein [Phycicoccus sonneraticus]MBM6401413.1 beta-lactamase family protein [Phycicoccus sonneraticus]